MFVSCYFVDLYVDVVVVFNLVDLDICYFVNLNVVVVVGTRIGSCKCICSCRY